MILGTLQLAAPRICCSDPRWGRGRQRYLGIYSCCWRFRTPANQLSLEVNPTIPMVWKKYWKPLGSPDFPNHQQTVLIMVMNPMAQKVSKNQTKIRQASKLQLKNLQGTVTNISHQTGSLENHGLKMTQKCWLVVSRRVAAITKLTHQWKEGLRLLFKHQAGYFLANPSNKQNHLGGVVFFLGGVIARILHECNQIKCPNATKMVQFEGKQLHQHR